MTNAKNQQSFIWISVDEVMPDSDMTVLICQPDCSEPVWLGYLDGEVWMTVEGHFATGVTHWSHLPAPMEAR